MRLPFGGRKTPSSIVLTASLDLERNMTPVLPRFVLRMNHKSAIFIRDTGGAVEAKQRGTLRVFPMSKSCIVIHTDRGHLCTDPMMLTCGTYASRLDHCQFIEYFKLVLYTMKCNQAAAFSAAGFSVPFYLQDHPYFKIPTCCLRVLQV